MDSNGKKTCVSSRRINGDIKQFFMLAAKTENKSDVSSAIKGGSVTSSIEDPKPSSPPQASSNCTDDLRRTSTKAVAKKRKVRKSVDEENDHDKGDQEFLISLTKHKRKKTLKREKVARVDVNDEDLEVSEPKSTIKIGLPETCEDPTGTHHHSVTMKEVERVSVKSTSKPSADAPEHLQSKKKSGEKRRGKPPRSRNPPLLLVSSDDDQDGNISCSETVSRKSPYRKKRRPMRARSSDDDDDVQVSPTINKYSSNVKGGTRSASKKGNESNKSQQKCVIKPERVDKACIVSTPTVGSIGIGKYFTATPKFFDVKDSGTAENSAKAWNSAKISKKDVGLAKRLNNKYGALKPTSAVNLEKLDGHPKLDQIMESKTENKVKKSEEKSRPTKVRENDSAKQTTKYKLKSKKAASASTNEILSISRPGSKDGTTKEVNSLRRSSRSKAPVSYAEDFPDHKTKSSPHSKSLAESIDSVTNGKVSSPRSPRGRPDIRIKTSRKSEVESSSVVRAKKLLNEAIKSSTSKPSKLAPIFTGGSRNSRKKKMDAAMLRKRRKFLMSGIPEKLQQEIAVAKAHADLIGDGWFSFIGHVTQNADESSVQNLLLPKRNLNFRDVAECKGVSATKWILGEMSTLGLKDFQRTCTEVSSEASSSIPEKLSNEEVQTCLDRLKKSHPSVDVSSIYNHYVETRDKIAIIDAQLSTEQNNSADCVEICDSDDGTATGKSWSDAASETMAMPTAGLSADPGQTVCHALWTHAYQPESHQRVVENEDAVGQLATWLGDWKKENAKKIAKVNRKPVALSRRKKQLESSDESEDTNCSDDEETRCCNSVLLVGPMGTGKTSIVYCLAKDLDFKVFEVNASSRRNGKLVLERLREATQSHQVYDAKKNGTSCGQAEDGIHSFCTPARKTTPRLKDEEKSRNVMPIEKNVPSLASSLSLILFEDIDLLLDDDDGFWSAVNTFMATAKRPVVLSTSDSRFSQRGKIREDFLEIQFGTPRVSVLALHLQLMSLTESFFVSSDQAINLIRHHDADFRKSILSMQFYCQSTRSSPADNFDDFWKYLGKLRPLDLIHFDLPRHFGASDFKVPFKVDVDLRRKLSGKKIAIVRRTQSEKTAFCGNNGTMSSIFDHLCTADKFFSTVGRPIRRSILRNSEILPGLGDAVSSTHKEEDYVNDSLSVDILDYFSDMVAALSIDFIQANRHLELVLDIERFRRESLQMIKTISDCSQPIMQYGQSAILMDVLPSLRDICRSELANQSTKGKRGRRNSHYLSSSTLYLDDATILQLSQNFNS